MRISVVVSLVKVRAVLSGNQVFGAQMGYVDSIFGSIGTQLLELVAIDKLMRQLLQHFYGSLSHSSSSGHSKH